MDPRGLVSLRMPLVWVNFCHSQISPISLYLSPLPALQYCVLVLFSDNQEDLMGSEVTGWLIIAMVWISCHCPQISAVTSYLRSSQPLYYHFLVIFGDNEKDLMSSRGCGCLIMAMFWVYHCHSQALPSALIAAPTSPLLLLFGAIQ